MHTNDALTLISCPLRESARARARERERERERTKPGRSSVTGRFCGNVYSTTASVGLWPVDSESLIVLNNGHPNPQSLQNCAQIVILYTQELKAKTQAVLTTTGN